MLKTINFHVGSGRCGSTLIQALFNDKMFHDIFAQNSIKYDPHIYRDTGVIAHDETFIPENWQPIKDQYFTPMESMPEQAFFVTQENLLGMRPEKDQKNICDVSCQKIAFLSEGYHPKIIIIVRRQDGYIESLYNQCIKRYETREFQTFVDDFPRENWHWADNIETYAKFFGRENVTVIPFEQKAYPDSGHSGFLAAVLMATGVQARLAFQNLPIVNPSIAPRAVEVMRVANKHLSKREAHRLADWFEENVQKDPNDRYRLMSDELRREIIDYYKESNTRLCDEYFTEYPAAKAYFTGADL